MHINSLCAYIANIDCEVEFKHIIDKSLFISYLNAYFSEQDQVFDIKFVTVHIKINKTIIGKKYNINKCL